MTYATPEDFGAVGDESGDGTGTDDRAAFQAALNSSRRLILDQNKTYRIDGTLEVPRFQQIIGPATRANTDFWTATQTGATRLLFTGSGSACFVNQDPTVMQSHGCMKGFLVRNIGSYGFIIDFNSTLDWLFMHLGLEVVGAGGGIRSTKIAPGTGPSWINKMFDVSIRLPDYSGARTMDLDWSDSSVESCQLTGGVGAIDRGYGIRWLNNQIERSKYIGLTIDKVEATKTSQIIGNLFDINKTHGLAFVTGNDISTNYKFNTTVSANVFRTADPANPGASGASTILLHNTRGSSYRLGPLIGNQEMITGVPQFVLVGTWTGPANVGNLQA